MTDRVAVLSDTHGNLTAFEAVLEAIEREGVDLVVHLGDVVGKGPRGSACVALARERCDVVVRGNWDEWLGGEPLRLREEDAANADAVRWWHEELSGEDRAWLRSRPFSASVEVGDAPVRLVHASTTGVWTRVRRRHTAEEAASFFTAALGPVPRVACYGDLHHAFEEPTPDGLLVNVGSVGNPLDEPRASYVVVETGATGPAVRFERVAYDVEAEVAVADAVGMPQRAEWARELREAYYRGRND